MPDHDAPNPWQAPRTADASPHSAEDPPRRWWLGVLYAPGYLLMCLVLGAVGARLLWKLLAAVPGQQGRILLLVWLLTGAAAAIAVAMTVKRLWLGERRSSADVEQPAVTEKPPAGSESEP